MAPVNGGRTCEETRYIIEAMRMPAHDPTAVYRVSSIGSMRFDPSLRIGQGMDFNFRMGEKHPIFVVNECLYHYRHLENSITRFDPVARGEAVREVFRKATKRRGIEVLPATRRFVSRSTTAGNNQHSHFVICVKESRRERDWTRAIKAVIDSIRFRPFDWHFYLPIVHLLWPFKREEPWERCVSRSPEEEREVNQ